MDNKNYNRPLIPVLLSIIPGIITGLNFTGFFFPAICFIIISLFFIIYNILKKKQLKWIPLIFFFSVAYLLCQPYLDFKFSANHIKLSAANTKYLITGVVESRPVEKKRSCSFILKVQTLAASDEIAKAVTGKIRVSARGDKLIIKKGDKLSFKSKIRCFRNFSNPGGFDYEQYMAFKGVWGSAFVKGRNLEIIHPLSFSPVVKAQDAVIKLIDQTICSKEVAGVLKALIIGDKQWISKKLRNSFNRTGTGHLLAISGLHIGIAGAFFFWFFCFILSYSYYLLWKAEVLKYSGLLALIPVIIYGLIAGMSASTQRAVIMVSVVLLNYSFQAEYDIMNSLAFAAIVILVFSPVSLLSVSFQLSFTAVFSIAYGMSVLENKAYENTGFFDLKKIIKKIAGYLLVSFFAFAGTFPMVLYYFNQVSLIGMVSNFILIPLIGFVVVPFGLFAVFVYPLSLLFAEILMKIAGFVLENALFIIHFLADLPFASVKTVTPSLIEILAYYCLFILVIYFIRLGKNQAGHNTKRAKIISGIVLLVVFADISFWINKRFFNKAFKVVILDVGQGSSALLEFPYGKTMLIDGGGFNNNSSFNIGERIIAPFLWKKKIGTIDKLVLSHPESDHLNGLLYILEHFNVKQVWSNGQSHYSEAYNDFQEIIKRKNIEHLMLGDIKNINEINGVAIKVLYPPEDFIEKQKIEKWRNMNNNSLVLRAEYKKISFLFPGDIMKKAEAELVGLAGDNLKSTVLIAPHHGSKTSDTSVFLARVQPEYAVISAGWHNRFKMPHVSVLKRLNDMGIKIFRTDKDGAVSIVVNEDLTTIYRCQRVFQGE